MLTQIRPIASVLLIAVLLLGVGAALLLESRVPSPTELVAMIRALGFWAPVAIIALMILHSIVPFPAEVLAVCAGAIFGTMAGSMLIWVGAMIGALLAFGLSRALGRTLVDRLLSAQKRDALDRWSSDQGAMTLLMSRFIPLIAFNLINYAAGLTNIRVWTFLWTTGLGIIPVTVLSAYLGAQMKNMDWGTLFILSGLGILVIWIGNKVARNQGWLS